MAAIYLQESIKPKEEELLKLEFPQYKLFKYPLCDDWSEVEILFGGRLTEEELAKAAGLKWIHCPTPETEELCIESISKNKNIITTVTKGQNADQTGEFVMGGILAFAKQFLKWKDAGIEKELFWNHPLKQTLWTLKGKTILQVGLGEVGTQIVKRAAALGMKTWGIRKQRSFHPYCQKTFPIESLHALLPKCDVISIALPGRDSQEFLFKEEEFNLMKSDSIFILVGSATHIDEEALAAAAQKGIFRGILIDAFESTPLSPNSPLWGMQSALITPSIASFPQGEETAAFKQFRQNLRLFVSERIKQMKNLAEEIAGEQQ